MSASKSTDKFTDIMKYLDEVQAQGECFVPSLEDDVQSISTSAVDSNHGSLLAETVLAGLRTKIDTLQKRLHKKECKILELETHLKETTEKECTAKQQLKEDTQQELNRHQREADVIQKRNMKFINALLADKDMLTSRIESLSVELKTIQDQHKREFEGQQEETKKILQRQKGLWAATQKRERQGWIEEQTKKIKQKTLKSLEPDITQLINRHKAEKRRMEEDKVDELKRKDQVIEQLEQNLISVKAKCNRTVEEALVRERELFHTQLSTQATRLERQMEEQRRVAALEREGLERSIEEERRSYLREVSDLKARLDSANDFSTNIAHKFENEVGAERAKLQREKNAEIEALTIKMEDEKQQQIKELGAQLRQGLEQEFEQQQKEFRKQVTTERDEQIEAVIKRLEDVSVEQQMLMDKKNKKLQDTCSSQEKRISVLQEDNKRIQTLYEDTNTEREKAKLQLSQLRKTIDELKDEHRQEVEELQCSHTVSTEEKKSVWISKYNTQNERNQKLLEQQTEVVLQLQQQITNMKQLHNKEVTELKQNASFEMEEINVKIKEALNKKDNAIRDLKEILQRLECKNKQLEDVLKQQNMLLANNSLIEEE